MIDSKWNPKDYPNNLIKNLYRLYKATKIQFLKLTLKNNLILRLLYPL